MIYAVFSLIAHLFVNNSASFAGCRPKTDFESNFFRFCSVQVLPGKENSTTLKKGEHIHVDWTGHGGSEL